MDASTIEHLAAIICGDDSERHPTYRSSTYLTRFFQNAGLPRFIHDGSTRKWWVVSCLNDCTREELAAVIRRLASPREYGGDRQKTAQALKALNDALYLEGTAVRLNGLEPYFEKISVNFDSLDEGAELKPLPRPNFDNLDLEYGIANLLGKRWDEIQLCIDTGAHLSAAILMGSMLEGMLLGVCLRFPREANTAIGAPRDRAGKVLPFQDWSLSQMIDVAHQAGWLGLDVKKFSHALREFRNLIHPYEQLATRANPDSDTCKISWLVVQAAVNDLTLKLRRSQS